MTRMTSTLTRLSAETWGEKLRRARDRARLNVRQAAALIDPYVTTSYATLARIERNSEQRPKGRAAQIAYVALLAYGIDPRDFDLDELSECRALNARSILSDLEQRRGKTPSASSRCMGVSAGPRARRRRISGARCTTARKVTGEYRAIPVGLPVSGR
jgi:hypothetical protein